MRQLLTQVIGSLGGLLLSVALVACSDQPDASATQHGDAAAHAKQAIEGDPADTAQQSGARSGVLTVDGRKFEIALSMCITSPDDILVSGPANESGGGVSGYFDGDIVDVSGQPYGELRLDIGATGSFDSSDEFIVVGSSAGGELVVAEDGAGYVITAGSRDDAGTDLGTATFEFSCD